ncbi:nuclease-related domain-containing protein [Cytobacillus sp. FJAT-54145]|uniref:Nuclease-related domain-containing protein n=1 Tax=Cytobacillus spartinae TaxID=3299023 RepID=A0ABW6KDB1_9BACI
MIVKELSVRKNIKKAEALLNRLPEEHPKVLDIKQDLVKMWSGQKGERAVSYYLDYLPEKEFFFLHDIRLPHGKYHFQIDYFIISSRFILILESKNFYGTLFFDNSFRQLIRTSNDQEEGFPDPISQAKWHKVQLCGWLEEQFGCKLPVEYLVVISHPSTILKTDPRNIEVKKHVVHGQSLLERIEELGSKYKEDCLDVKQIRKLSKLLLKSHVDEDTDILKRYGILKDELIKGVQCPGCKRFAMVREKRKWLCQSCGKFDKLAHFEAIKDYFLLVGETITNQQFRDFVGIASVDMASKLLIRMKLPSSGTNKGRYYYSSKDFFSG